ncbi:NifU-like N terminal domain-containing protein [Paraphysoderma sedebokerense]|nr:NifU-like N terminal domain-containing protein [Paraphysoderma sedebokerense]
MYAIRSAIPRLSSLSSLSPAAAATTRQPILRASYHSKVIDHYENPRNVGSLPAADPTVGTGLVGAPACGDVMKLQIKVDESTGKIVDARFKTFGCGSAIASSSYVTTLLKGKNLDEAVKIRNTEIAKDLKLPPVKLHCSMLAEDAVKAAIKNFQEKKKLKSTPPPPPSSTPSQPSL